MNVSFSRYKPASTQNAGDQRQPPNTTIARNPAAATSYLAGNDSKTLADQIREARRFVPQGEYHFA